MLTLSPDRPLVMDAAMGTRLLPLDLPCCELASLRRPSAVAAVHAAHVAAGARVLLTNTFQANPATLACHGLESQLDDLVQRAIRLARQVAGGAAVLGSVGPIHSPGQRDEFTDRAALAQTLAAFQDVDGILFETCSSPAALAAVEFALHRAVEIDGLPLLLSLCYYRNVAGELVTRSGHAPEVFARNARRHGVAALGVNCGKDIGLEDIEEILSRYRAETDLPLFARPNGGTPSTAGVYSLDPTRYAAMVPRLTAAGASMLGGCCGTTEAHLAAVARSLAQNDRTPPP